MAVALLDVNVLIALAWDRHQHHPAAVRWFQSQELSGWATCPMTQAGFVRISSNPRAFADATSPAEARAVLERAISRPSHRFWPDDLPLADTRHIAWERMHGHQQVTDAYLLGLSLYRGGRFATFDRRTTALPRTPQEAAAIELIPT